VKIDMLGIKCADCGCYLEDYGKRLLAIVSKLYAARMLLLEDFALLARLEDSTGLLVFVNHLSPLFNISLTYNTIVIEDRSMR
jgi:hypothetical protein